MKELDSEAEGVLEVIVSDLSIVSSQILRRVERSGSIFEGCGDFDVRWSRSWMFESCVMLSCL
jgi:hypothetical protein